MFLALSFLSKRRSYQPVRFLICGFETNIRGGNLFGIVGSFPNQEVLK